MHSCHSVRGTCPQGQAAALKDKDADDMLVKHDKITWSIYCPFMSDLSTAEHYSGTDVAFVHGDESGRLGMHHVVVELSRSVLRASRQQQDPSKTLHTSTQPPHLSPTTPHRNIPPNSGNTVAHPYRYHRHRHLSQIVIQHGWRR
jgi:hypothetical protein